MAGQQGGEKLPTLVTTDATPGRAFEVLARYDTAYFLDYREHEEWYYGPYRKSYQQHSAALKYFRERCEIESKDEGVSSLMHTRPQLRPSSTRLERGSGSSTQT